MPTPKEQALAHIGEDHANEYRRGVEEGLRDADCITGLADEMRAREEALAEAKERLRGAVNAAYYAGSNDTINVRRTGLHPNTLRRWRGGKA